MKRRLLFMLLPVFSLLLLCHPAARAQGVVAEGEAVPFHISSLGTGFAMQGDFEGEYTVYPKAVRVRLTKALVRIGTHCPYKGPREFHAIQFALGTDTEEGSWKRVFKSRKYTVRRVMLPGDEYTFDGVEFVIPKRAATDLTKHWFVVHMDDFIVDGPLEDGTVEGFAFAHSCRDIFVKKELP